MASIRAEKRRLEAPAARASSPSPCFAQFGDILRLVRWMLFLGVATSACGSPVAVAPSGPPTTLEPAEPPSSGPVLARAMDPSAARECTALLRVGTVSAPNPSCEFRDTPSKQRGYVHYACADGEATGSFVGLEDFRGRVANGRLHLEARRERDGSDGCRWESVQTIDGALDHSVLELSVRERVVTGTGCATSCLGGAPVRIER